MNNYFQVFVIKCVPFVDLSIGIFLTSFYRGEHGKDPKETLYQTEMTGMNLRILMPYTVMKIHD